MALFFLISMFSVGWRATSFGFTQNVHLPAKPRLDSSTSLFGFETLCVVLDVSFLALSHVSVLWISGRVTKPDNWGRQNSHCDFRLGMFPARLTLVVSDIDRELAWAMGVALLDLRTAREESAVPTPGDTQWRTHSPDAFRGKLKRNRPTKDEIPCREPIGKWIWVDLGVFWYHAQLTISRAEGGGATFHRGKKRSAPGTGHWAVPLLIANCTTSIHLAQ